MEFFVLDSPSCLRWEYSTYEETTACYWKVADIVSTSYLGIFLETSDFNIWTIVWDYHEYGILEITDFDIGCDTGAIFEITNGNAISKHCNKNRPVDPIVSMFERLMIKTYITSEKPYVLVEGFRGKYKSEYKNRNISSFTSFEENGKLYFRPSIDPWVHSSIHQSSLPSIHPFSQSVGHPSIKSNNQSTKRPLLFF